MVHVMGYSKTVVVVSMSPEEFMEKFHATVLSGALAPAPAPAPEPERPAPVAPRNRRDKVCKLCQEPFEDDSLRGNRKYCDAHVLQSERVKYERIQSRLKEKDRGRVLRDSCTAARNVC